jgi:hypothetical protein
MYRSVAGRGPSPQEAGELVGRLSRASERPCVQYPTGVGYWLDVQRVKVVHWCRLKQDGHENALGRSHLRRLVCVVACDMDDDLRLLLDQTGN